ncbi:unnamed protein product, partial [Mycena citricolor]
TVPAELGVLVASSNHLNAMNARLVCTICRREIWYHAQLSLPLFWKLKNYSFPVTAVVYPPGRQLGLGVLRALTQFPRDMLMDAGDPIFLSISFLRRLKMIMTMHPISQTMARRRLVCLSLIRKICSR